jgi:hypothetical protein
LIIARVPQDPRIANTIGHTFPRPEHTEDMMDGSDPAPRDGFYDPT